MELIGITAGEAKDPKKTLTRAIQSTIWRILIFYIGAIFVIVTVYPWDQLSTIGSPFVATLRKLVLRQLGLINFVVITAAMSGCNSGIYSAGRMLYTLGVNGQAPKYFTKLSGNGVPLFGTVGVIIGLAVGVVLSYIAPKTYSYMYIVRVYFLVWYHGLLF